MFRDTRLKVGILPPSYKNYMNDKFVVIVEIYFDILVLK